MYSILLAILLHSTVVANLFVMADCVNLGKKYQTKWLSSALDVEDPPQGRRWPEHYRRERRTSFYFALGIVSWLPAHTIQPPNMNSHGTLCILLIHSVL